MGKKLALRIAVTIIALLAVSYIAIKNMRVPDVNLRRIDFTSLQDGLYRGAFVLGPVSAEVLVTVRSGSVVFIEIIKHGQVMGKRAERIAANVVEAQSLDVDMISGATWSSKAILKAIEVAVTNESK